jgi:hypothetical protein
VRDKRKSKGKCRLRLNVLNGPMISLKFEECREIALKKENKNYRAVKRAENNVNVSANNVIRVYIQFKLIFAM